MKIILPFLLTLCFFCNASSSSSDVLLQGHLDYFRSVSLYSPLENHSFQEDSKRAFYIVGIPLVFSNGIIEKECNSTLNETQIDETINYFNAKKLPFIWWTSSKELEKKDFTCIEICTGIVLDLTQTTTIPSITHPNLTIKIAESEEELKDFSEICRISYQLTPTIFQQFHAVNKALLEAGIFSYFIAYLDDKPVSALTLCMGTTAGIWNLSTLSDYQKQGIATALIQTAIIEAKKYHYTHVIAFLDHRQLAKSIFKKLEFETIHNLFGFIYTPHNRKSP